MACLGASAPGVFSRAGEAALPGDAGAPPGGTTSVPLSLSDASGFLGGDFTITYDPAVVAVTDLSLTPLSSGCALTFNLDPPGMVRVSLYGAFPLEGAGDLLTVSLLSVGPLDSETPLTITSAQINEAPIPVTSGHYCVEEQVAEVHDLAGSLAAGVATLMWAPDPAADRYNVYRAGQPDLGDLGLLVPGLTSTTASDSDTPAPLFLYLVTAVNCRGEGTAGEDSQGAPRMLPAP